jgi:hypothetical protein
MLHAAEARASAAEAAALKAERRAYELGSLPEIDEGPIRPAVRGVAGNCISCCFPLEFSRDFTCCLVWLGLLTASTSGSDNSLALVTAGRANDAGLGVSEEVFAQEVTAIAETIFNELEFVSRSVIESFDPAR